MAAAEEEIAALKAELAALKAPKPTLGEMMRAPETCYGTCVLSTSPKWVNAVASCGLDFVFIDTEHVPIDRAQLSWMCNAYKSAGLPPLVRIAAPDPYQACCALDGGACGIVAPYLETVEQVKALRGAVKLRPYKGQRLQEKLDGVEGASPEHEAAYVAKANRQNALVLNIESQPAIDMLDEILKVPDIDCLLIGPHDLSCNLGVPEQFDHPKFVAAVASACSDGGWLHLRRCLLAANPLLPSGAHDLGEGARGGGGSRDPPGQAQHHGRLHARRRDQLDQVGLQRAGARLRHLALHRRAQE